MIILLNGAFGIGKTSVARVLARRLPRAVLYDPELAGIAMQRLARMIGREVSDFQDLHLWRRFTIVAIRIVRMFRPNVVVPMAFSNVAYLQEIERGIGRFERRVHHFCLVAPLHVVEGRLGTRRLTEQDAQWQYRRAAECCVEHRAAAFATHIDASDRSVEEIAAAILDAAGAR